MITSEESSNPISFSEKTYLTSCMCATCSELPSSVPSVVKDIVCYVDVIFFNVCHENWACLFVHNVSLLSSIELLYNRMQPTETKSMNHETAIQFAKKSVKLQG